MESYFPGIGPLMEPGPANPSSTSYWFTQKDYFVFQCVCSVIRVKNTTSGALIHEGYKNDHDFIGYKKRIVLKREPLLHF